MNILIKKNIDNIAALCKTHKVNSMFLFGSATNADFSQQSDVDFLVRFSDSIELMEYADNYFDFLASLENLLQRNVDLVSEKSLKNPVLIKQINKTKKRNASFLI